MRLLRLLSSPKHFLLFAGGSVLLFDVFYVIMATLPGEDQYMCVPGANLTVSNLLFAGAFSVVLSIVLVGLWALFSVTSRKERVNMGALTGIGSVLALFTLFCTVCTLPVLSLFGLSIALGFFSSYNLIFKIVALVLLAGVLILLDRKLDPACSCRVPDETR